MPRQTLCLVPDAPIASIDPSKFFQIRNDFAMKGIRAKLTGSDWSVWNYLQMLDPYGDRMKDIPSPQEIAEAIDISAKQVRRSLLKLERLGFYEIGLSYRGRNLGGSAARKAKQRWFSADSPVSQEPNDSVPDSPVSQEPNDSAPDSPVSQEPNDSAPDSPVSQEPNDSVPDNLVCKELNDSVSDQVILQQTTLSQSSLETFTVKRFQKSQTIQTYSDLIQTLSEGMRESFEKFCLKKIEECSFKIASSTAWLNKHGAEYLQQFKEMYSESFTNPQAVEASSSKPKADIPDLGWIKQRFRYERGGWQAAAIHYGYDILSLSDDSPDTSDLELQPG